MRLTSGNVDYQQESRNTFSEHLFVKYRSHLPLNKGVYQKDHKLILLCNILGNMIVNSFTTLGFLTPLPLGISVTLRGGSMDIFWNHTIYFFLAWFTMALKLHPVQYPLLWGNCKHHQSNLVGSGPDFNIKL